MKASTDLQMAAAQQLTDRNRMFLSKQGLSTSDAALYLAHFLGPGGAAKVLGNNDMTSLSNVLSAQAIAANPVLQKMRTVGDLKAWANQKIGGSGYRNGGIASGPISGYSTTLHGTEAVVPLPDGKAIPVEMQNLRINGLGMDGSYFGQGISTDTKLTDMIMKRLGLTDFDSKRMINLSGIGTNMQVGPATIGSTMGPGVREALVDMVENLRNEGVSTQDALKATLDNFNTAMSNFLNTQSGGTQEGLAKVMYDLVDIQRQQLGTSRKILQHTQ